MKTSCTKKTENLGKRRYKEKLIADIITDVTCLWRC